ncbi:MAG: hypothetical protein B6I38_02240 [Anaerolineaceae bacterium 4572_5.1]|nr:MAG: hypothetical protein B6I38_02240 [Anaerolineaceae bacterium 4572_5.1]
MNVNLFSQKQKAESTRIQLELLYRVSRELASTLDLTTVLQRVLALSIDTVGADSGSIIILDDAGKPVDSAIIYKDQIIDHSMQQVQAILEQGLAGWVVRNCKATLVSDTSTDERWLQSPNDGKTARVAKSVIAVPILAREKLVGMATLSHSKPNSLTEEHLNLFQAIADQASMAVLNARLYNESQRQARVMTALAKSAGAMTSSIQLDSVLNNILNQIQEALQVEAVTLALVNVKNKELAYRAIISKNFSVNPEIFKERIPLGRGIIGQVAKRGKGIVIPDASKDSRIDNQLNFHPQFVPKAIACVPIRVRGDVIGVLEAINPQGGSFGSDALTVLKGISNFAGSSIQNAQLFEDLQIAHNRYHDLFENDINPIIISNYAGDILEINRQTIIMSQFSPNTLLGMTIDELHEVNWEEARKVFDTLNKGEPRSYESILLTKSGDTPPILVNVQSVQIAGEKRLQWLFQDITESKKLDQLRDDLTSMIYHDLRSPLANVISSLDMLEAMLPVEDKQEVQIFLDIATRSTKRIQRLTKSLLDINRLEAGQPITEQKAVSPLDIAHKAYQALLPVAHNKEQEVFIIMPKDIPLVYVDEDMIERVLINLLQNAIKYTPPNGKIEIGAQQENEQVRIYVKDTGPGIAPQAQDTIFNKFTRLNSKDGTKGIGLGLAFCRLAVEGHGGRIWVDNNADVGSVFSFTLPIANSA